MNKEKISLVLGGGGAKASFGVGIIKYILYASTYLNVFLNSLVFSFCFISIGFFAHCFTY